MWHMDKKQFDMIEKSMFDTDFYFHYFSPTRVREIFKWRVDTSERHLLITCFL